MTLQALIPSRARTGIPSLALAAMVMPIPAMADAFVFSTDNTDGLIATATRPSSTAEFEVETGDDFVLTQQTLLPGAAFTGLIPSGASRSDEVYRVFPADSDVNIQPREGGMPDRSVTPGR
jgi:hypothetical protein